MVTLVPKKQKPKKEDVCFRCSATANTPGFPCHNAMDLNKNSVWIPGKKKQLNYC